MKNINLESENSEGCLEGYIVNCLEENYQNFLLNNVENSEQLNTIINFIKENKIEKILVVKNLNVNEEYQGQGIGRSLLDEALEDCDISILISDKYESQREGFNLNKFYEDSDFLTITETSAGSLMCYPSDFAEQLKEKIYYKPNVIKKKSRKI